MRLTVNTDYKVLRDATVPYAEKAFTFHRRLAEQLDGLLLLGRVEPSWPMHFARLIPSRSCPSVVRTLRGRSAPAPRLVTDSGFWRSLDDVDCVWLLGAALFSIAFLTVAACEKSCVLGARQDLPRYVASHHPRAARSALALLIEGAGGCSPAGIRSSWSGRTSSGGIAMPATLGVYVSLVDEPDIEDAVRDPATTRAS